MLIIDSGSTKTEWVLLDGKTVKNRFTTEGFNPNYSGLDGLEHLVSLVETQNFAPLQGEIQSIHYYGTGCGSERNCQLINKVLQRHFPDTEITVTHDLMATCHASLGHHEGIACILGTGSNSCVYDGNEIVERAVSLGYLAGDEGSGMHIGREVVRSYFYGFMPDGLQKEFEAVYHLELKDFVDQLYRHGQPSRYLASFAKFAGERQSHPFLHDLVRRCFEAFLEAFVFRFECCTTLRISFVGSVAYHFQDIVRECLTEAGLTLGSVMAHPADGLVDYYRNVSNKK